MPLEAIPGFCQGSYNSRAPGASAARTVNLNVEKNEGVASKSEFTLFPRSGKKAFTLLPTGPIQGCWANRYRTFWAAGGTIYEVFVDGTFNVIGQVTVGSNPVTFRANGTELLVCSGGNVYVATGSEFFQPIISYQVGFVNVAGAVVTWVSGAQFNNDNQQGAPIAPGDLFMIAAPNAMGVYTHNLYAVESIESATQLTLNVVAGTWKNVPYQVGAPARLATDPPNPIQGVMVEFIDGYFIVNQPNSKTFWLSALNDGTTWNALDFGVKQGSIDNIAALAKVMGYLVLVGDTDSTEIWGDSGSSNFPFARVQGMTLEIGTTAAWSVKKLSTGQLAWLIESDGGEHQIVMSMGAMPQRISDHALENAMRSYGLIYDAIGSTYIENGQEHYRIDFPTADRTWDYNNSSHVWTEQGVPIPNQEDSYSAERGRYRCHVTWPGGQPMDLVGDFQSGQIWQVSPDFDDDAGVPIEVMRIAPHINTNLQRATGSEFALDCELGTVDPTLTGPDGKRIIPTVELWHSDNGAKTWVDDGAASLGRFGEYDGTYLTHAELTDTTPGSQTHPQTFICRPYWNSLGSFWIARTYRIRSTAAYLKAIFNGLASVE